MDFHDLRVCDQCEAAEFQLGKTPADQLAEDKLRFQQDDDLPQRLGCGCQAWIRREEAIAAHRGAAEGGLQSRAKA